MNTTFTYSATRTSGGLAQSAKLATRLSRHGNWLAICLAAWVLAGCGTTQEAAQPLDNQPNLPSNVVGDGAIRFDTDDARVAELWSSAEAARSAADPAAALGFLVEALEVSPRSSLIWSRAAELQLETRQALLAENYALKSNEYAANNGRLLHRNWLIIEHARALRGDLLGVRSAHKQVQLYQYQ